MKTPFFDLEKQRVKTKTSTTRCFSFKNYNMTNNSNNINNQLTVNNFFQTVDKDKIEKHLNKSNSPKLLVLNLNDLNANIINQLKEKQCRMLLLNENFKIVEYAKINQIQRIQLTIDGCRQSVAVKNIMRFEASGSYTYVFLKDHDKPVLTSKTLKFYADQFSEDTFVRPHQSHLVNRNFVNAFVLKPKPTLILKDGCKISIARRKLSAFKKWSSIGI